MDNSSTDLFIRRLIVIAIGVLSIPVLLLCLALALVGFGATIGGGAWLSLLKREHDGAFGDVGDTLDERIDR